MREVRFGWCCHSRNCTAALDLLDVDKFGFWICWTASFCWPFIEKFSEGGRVGIIWLQGIGEKRAQLRCDWTIFDTAEGFLSCAPSLAELATKGGPFYTLGADAGFWISYRWLIAVFWIGPVKSVCYGKIQIVGWRVITQIIWNFMERARTRKWLRQLAFWQNV